MKNSFLILITLIALSAVSCKKDYACTAIDESGAEAVFNCENCSKDDVSEYEASILEAGYVSADCAK